MNCEEYREAITADPSESFADGAHSAGCDDCRRYRDGMRALDRHIAAALAIDVPPLRMPDLPSALDESGDVVKFPGRPGKVKVSTPLWLGIAASLVVAAFVGLTLLSPEPSGTTLAEQVIAHMDYEQASRQVTSASVPERELHEVIGSRVSAMDTGIGLVSYAQSCVINGNTVPHLVIQGESGPVTLILLPDEQIDEAIPLTGEHVHGIIVPVGGGSVAIIGERTQQLGEIDEIRQRIVESVEWQI